MADVTITDALMLFTKVNEKIVRRLEALEKEAEQSNVTSPGIGDNKIPDKLPDKLPVKKVDDIKPNNSILNKILGELKPAADNLPVTKPLTPTLPQISQPVTPAIDTDVKEKEKQTEIVEEVKPVYIEEFSDKAIKQLSKIIGKDVEDNPEETEKKEGKGSILRSILDTFVSMGKGILSAFTQATKLLGPIISSIGPLVRALGPAAAIAAAGFVGWEIGSYLEDKFKVSDKIAKGVSNSPVLSEEGAFLVSGMKWHEYQAEQEEIAKRKVYIEQLKKDKHDLERAAYEKGEKTFEFKGNKYTVGDSKTKIPQLPPTTTGEIKPPQLPTTDMSSTTNSITPPIASNILNELKPTADNQSQTPQLTTPAVNTKESQGPSLAAPKEISVVSPQTNIPPIKPVTDTNKPNDALKVTQESNSNFKTYAQRTHDLLAEQIKISTQTNKALYEVADKLKGDTNIVTSATTISNNYGNTSGLRELQGALS